MTTSSTAISQTLECLNPAFNTAAPGVALNGKILRAQSVADMKAIDDPSVSAVILDASNEGNIKAIRDFIAATGNQRKAFEKTLNDVYFWKRPPAVVSEFKGFLHSIFPASDFNGPPQGSGSLGIRKAPSKEYSAHFNEYGYGRFRKFFVMEVNLGGQTENGAGTKYLLTPVTEERYRNAIADKPLQEVVRDNPDLEWGELKPGEIILYKGGKVGEQDTVLIIGGPDAEPDKGQYAFYRLSDEFTPFLPLA